ncbi:MAG: hypothetical protein DRO87_05650 [Candidatus Thorarchaeota archaeon]|nr:MAG: hypothetical protein DRP09_07245 [Candidatus Thorarchaeota archaeon]RLI58443.1 MAG: hypothetical protein DRO87_05650 [Candidatus Thorarchaeota archaeon]
MKLWYQGNLLPYPTATLRARLRLSGLSRADAEAVIARVSEYRGAHQDGSTESEIHQRVLEVMNDSHSDASGRFATLVEYEEKRYAADGLDPIILVIEGASATGKSMLSLDLIEILAATRLVTTDTVRQVFRGVVERDKHPELFCHTYQAHKYRQEGPANLSKYVRGYLAQTDIITPYLETTMRRLLTEGAVSVVEGVHIIPGEPSKIGPTVVEVVINPDRETHETMFYSKADTGRLRTVSADRKTRLDEFTAAREIQEYMVDKAQESGVEVVPLTDYDDASQRVASLVMSTIEKVLRE